MTNHCKQTDCLSLDARSGNEPTSAPSVATDSVAAIAAREFGTICLALRQDLIFTPQALDSQPYMMVEDPLNSRFFRLGYVEYTFVSLLDGASPVNDALRHLSTVLPHHSLSEIDAAGLCRWLVEMDLAHTAESSQAVRLAHNAARVAQRQTVARLNLLALRLPLGSPDRLIASVAKYCGWLRSPWIGLVWMTLLLCGIYSIVSEWERFTSSTQGVFAPDNWLWLAACWIGLKVVHEFSHGLVCKLYGGRAREFGFIFVFLAPMPYVDVTSSWRFRSRLQRIHVAAAGMLVESAIASIAAMVWSNTSNPWLGHLCYNTIVMASVATLAFNANPLMKFDGYYILSDALAMPNLYANGQRYLCSWAKRYLLGIPSPLPHWSPGQGTFIRGYAWMAFIFRIVICCTLVVTALALFQGAGILLALMAVLAWLVYPALTFGKFLVNGAPGQQPRRLRFLLTTGVVLALSSAMLSLVPWLGARRAPAVVEYSPQTILRAKSEGFVRAIHVENGQHVDTGQLLISLENDELARDLAMLEIQLQQSEVRGRRHEQKGELAAQQAEAELRIGLQTQLSEKRNQVDQLEVRARHAGKLIRRKIGELLGTYVKVGDEILSIGNENMKELQVTLSQDDLDAFTQREGELVTIDVPRQSLWHSRLDKVSPRATLEPLHPALVATNGGLLAVKRQTQSQTQPDIDAVELLEPRFTATIPLDSARSQTVSAGQTAKILYRPCSESLGQHLYYALSRWIRERIKSQDEL